MIVHRATLIPGDGIGPEITAATLRVVEATGVRIEWDEQLGSVAALDRVGTPLPDATVESIRKTRVALKGPLTTPVGTGFRSEAATRIRAALHATLSDGDTRTPDLGGHATTTNFADAVLRRLG